MNLPTIKSLIFFLSLLLSASHSLATGSVALGHQSVLTPTFARKSFTQALPIVKNNADRMLIDAFKEKEIAELKGWKDPFLDSKTMKLTKEFQELDYKKNTGVSKNEKNNFYPLAYEKNEAGNSDQNNDQNSAQVLNIVISLLLDTADNIFLKGNAADIHGIINLGNSDKQGAVGNKDDRSPEKNKEQPKGQNQQASSQVKPGKRKLNEQEELMLELTPQEAAEHFLNTIYKLSREHDLSIRRIIEKKKDKKPGCMKFHENCYITSRYDVKEIFVDFIMFIEGLLRDQKFVYSNDTNKYLPDKTISNERVKTIDSLLKELFTKEGKRENPPFFLGRQYYLGWLLSDYLYENYKAFDRQMASGYKHIGRKTFLLFERVFYKDGFFSEFVDVMRFTGIHNQEIDEGTQKYRDLDSAIKCQTFILHPIKSNDELRTAFNKDIMESKFNRRWLDTLNNMFEKKPDSDGQVIAPDNDIHLKFGEELEYNLKKIPPSNPHGCHYTILSSHLINSGANETSSYPFPNLTFDGRFHVMPFLDNDLWLEMNCTPYYDDEDGVDDCLEKVFESVDLMIKNGLIDHASGHKHVDALSATHGDPGVLLELQREIESNPYLTRAFGNNDKIVKKDEQQWYKLFSDYSDMRGLAIKRINWMITTYNKQLENFFYKEVNGHWLTDSEKLDRLKQFANIYSHFVQMTPLQTTFGRTDDPSMDKYTAISLLHIPGTEFIEPYSTIEFRFFRCPENLRELKLINRFLTAWFKYILDRRMQNQPIEPVPDDVKASKDYTDEEVLQYTTQYLQMLGLNPSDYHSFLNKLSKDLH